MNATGGLHLEANPQHLHTERVFSGNFHNDLPLFVRAFLTAGRCRGFCLHLGKNAIICISWLRGLPGLSTLPSLPVHSFLLRMKQVWTDLDTNLYLNEKSVLFPAQ